MNPFFVIFPGFRKKALTLSYDDGVTQDIRMVELMDRHGIKGTFNINSCNYDGEELKTKNGHIPLEQARELYGRGGHEVAVHSRTHPFLEALPAGVAAWELVRDPESLEALFGGIIRGMAYPQGTYNDDVVATVKQCGLAYARDVKVTGKFDLPQDPYRWQCTCRHKDAALMELCDQFLTMPMRYGAKLFSMWGHSYEFDEPGGWEILEAFCEKMGGHEDIWYATNIQIFDYLHAAGQLRTSINGKRVHNPTATPLYLLVNKVQHVLLEPGQTLELD